MLRSDILKAMDDAPPNIGQHISSLGGRCLDLLNNHLADEEQVRKVSSAAMAEDNPYNCLLALTSQRVIFIAPTPQAVAWRLSAITHSQFFVNRLFIEGSGGKSHFLVDPVWGQKFESYIKQAVTISILAGG